MDDFDRLLECELRLMLYAVVTSPPPTRRGVPESGRSFLRVTPLPVVLAPAAAALVEPAVDHA
jgi:hypothetical protein